LSARGAAAPQVSYGACSPVGPPPCASYSASLPARVPAPTARTRAQPRPHRRRPSAFVDSPPGAEWARPLDLLEIVHHACLPESKRPAIPAERDRNSFAYRGTHPADGRADGQGERFQRIGPTGRISWARWPAFC